MPILKSALSGLVALLVASLLSLLWASMLSLFLGQRLIEQHLIGLMAKEMHFLDRTHVRLERLDNALAFIRQRLESVNDLLQQELPLGKTRIQSFSLLRGYLSLLTLMLQLWVVRVFVYASFLPLFGLLGLVALVDGLVQRHLRSLQAARESSLLYHRARDLLGLSWISGSVVYLITPVAIQPSWFFLSAASLWSLLFSITVRTFKKYG